MVSRPDNHSEGVRAFSLVEVVVAMAVIAFALILIVGLLPLGLKSNRDSVEESHAVNLLQALIADRQSSDFSTPSILYNLPALSDVTAPVSGTLYVMDDIATTNAQPATASYRVAYTIYPSDTVYPDATNYPAAGPPQPVLMNVKVSWPAAAPSSASSVETLTTFMQP